MQLLINEPPAPPPPSGVQLSTPDLTARAGSTIAIPININQAQGLEAFELSFSYDPTLLSIPATGPMVTAGDLNPTASVVANTAAPGLITISAAGTAPLAGGSGSIATLNLQLSDAVTSASTLLDLTSASINEGAISASLLDGTLTIVPPTFQVMNVRQLTTGLALQLPEAPDQLALNLYDGPDASIDQPDLLLTNAAGTAIALSAHWQQSSSELYLLANNPLAAGDYTLSIDSRADGLVAASTGELLDGNADGTTGDPFSYSFSVATPANSISIADTARGAGQQLSINGSNNADGITGLPVLLSSQSAITSLSGAINLDQNTLNAANLLSGSALPGDWTISVDATSQPGTLLYSASGTTAISGSDLELFRLDALVAPDTLTNGSYGSTTLIEINASSASDPAMSFQSDPGLVALAYSGDTTGNGGLSSLDASRIQQQVVGLEVESFPDLPDRPIIDPLA